MITKNKTRFNKNADAKSLTVTRNFDAPVQQVWEAWTNSEQLDKWWAPKPWRAVTKKMDFKEGGTWLYKMAGPAGEEQWSKADYKKIDAPDVFICTHSFTDAAGNINTEMPTMQWKNSFIQKDNGTQVKVEISFSKAGDLEKILSTGFEEGFNAGLENLDDLLSH